MYEYLNEETNKLIDELDSVASWYEEMLRCTNELKQYKPPKDYVVPVYEEFTELPKGAISGIAMFWGFCSPLAFLYGYYYLYFKTDILPNGFFMRILLLIVAFFLGFFAWAIGYAYLVNAFPPSESKADKEKRYQEYLQKKNEFDRKNRLSKQTNDTKYYELTNRILALGPEPPKNSVPPAYLNPQILRAFINYFKNGRASNLKEAINLFHQEVELNAKLTQMQLQMQQMQNVANDARNAADAAAYYARWASVRAGK